MGRAKSAGVDFAGVRKMRGVCARRLCVWGDTEESLNKNTSRLKGYQLVHKYRFPFDGPESWMWDFQVLIKSSKLET
jgi:hypothetical protein